MVSRESQEGCYHVGVMCITSVRVFMNISRASWLEHNTNTREFGDFYFPPSPRCRSAFITGRSVQYNRYCEYRYIDRLLPASRVCMYVRFVVTTRYRRKRMTRKFLFDSPQLCHVFLDQRSKSPIVRRLALPWDLYVSIFSSV